MKKLLILPVLLFASCGKKEVPQPDHQTTSKDSETSLPYREIENISLEIHVDDDGDDSADGSLASPFKTLEKARDHLRSLAKDDLKPGNIVVQIHGGTYPTRTSFLLEKEDSGTAESPVVYTSYHGEKVTISGGATLSSDSLETVSDPAILERLAPSVRATVRKLDFKKHGLTFDEFGQIQYWQMGGPKYPAEPGSVFIDGTELSLARYPKENGGEKGDGFVLTGKVVNPGSVPRYDGNRNPRGGIFHYTDPEVARWAAHENVWMYGYMKETYADGIIQIKAVDKDAGTIEAVQPSWYGIGEKGRYYYFNVLEQLTQPGESVVDPATSTVYLIPPAGSSEKPSVGLSLATEPLLVNKGASHTTFSGISFELTRGDAIHVTDASNVAFENLTLTYIGGNGIVMPNEGVTGNSISATTMDKIGGYPFLIGGGDRMAQTPGNCSVSDSRFSNFGLKRSGKSQLTGIGNTVHNCSFRGSKAGALSVSGNNQIVESNIFENLNLEGSDAGAVYCGRNPSETGIVIRHNFFQDIGNHLDKVTGIQGVYVDDRSGFVEVYGNIFHRVGSGVQAAAFKVNGGKHNSFHDNIVIGGRAAYIQVHTTEGDKWANWYADRPIVDKLAAVGYPDPNTPWAKQNPLAFKAASDKIQPDTTTNRLENNLVINGQLVHGIIKSKYGDPKAFEAGNQVIETDPGFRDMAAGDFHIPKETFEEKFPGIQWIDFEKIGPASK